MGKTNSRFNLSIAQSFAVAPIAAILALSAVAGLGTWSLMNASRTQDVVIEEMNAGLQLIELQADLQKINADVLGIVTRQAAGENVDVLASFEAVAGRVDGLSEKIETLGGRAHAFRPGQRRRDGDADRHARDRRPGDPTIDEPTS